MRYEGDRKSSKDPDIKIYSFSMGLDELILFRALADKALRYMPRINETTQTLGRLRNFMKTTDTILIKNYGYKYKTKKIQDPTDKEAM